jgi:Fe-S cluster biogenesis protein NfuA
MTALLEAAPAVDRVALERRIDQVCRLMSAHAGGIELVGVYASGAVRVRFTGMCVGCTLRPLTMRGTILPALSEIAGVTAVDADGTRISEEAAARLARYLGGPSTLPALEPGTPSGRDGC